MSYCVNCGVELHPTAKKCPLCNTPVYNPNEIYEMVKEITPFPEEKGAVEQVKRKDVAILVSAIMLATSVCCGILNRFVFSAKPWAVIVIGVCICLWVLLIPVILVPKQPVYVSILLDGIAVGGYLYMLTFLTGNNRWFLGLGCPIVVWITLIVEVWAVCLNTLPRMMLLKALYFVTAVALVCAGVEAIIDWYLAEAVSLDWSAIILTVCTILDIALVTLLCTRRLRNEVRRRLHF